MGNINKLNIVRAGNINQEKWDQYVCRKSKSSIYHRSNWLETVAEEYGMKNVSLAALSGEHIVGILPILQISNLTGKKHISLPYSMYGGPISDNTDIAKELVMCSRRHAEKGNAVLQIYSNMDINETGLNKYEMSSDYAIGLRFNDYEQHWIEGIGSGLRRNIKKSDECKIEVIISKDGAEGFYSLLLSHRNRLRLPTPRVEYYKSLIRNINSTILSCRIDGELVGAILLLEDDDVLYYAIPVYMKVRKECQIADRCVWDLVKHGYKTNKKEIRLGGHPLGIEGLDQFKKKWSNNKNQLYNYTSHTKDYNLEKYKTRGIPGWSFLPKPAARYIGYHVIRWFG